MTTDDRAHAAVPTAAALVCAVADRLPGDVARILADITDWHALAVVLAANVDPDSELGRLLPGRPLTDDQVADEIVTQAALVFGTTVDELEGTSRYRNVLDARAVAMAACRLAGLSSPYIGRRLNKDHSTVLYAASRVGENARLQRIARRIAAPVTRQSGLLGDEAETAA